MSIEPIIVVEPAVVAAATKSIPGYRIYAAPRNGGFDPSDYSGRKVILWPDASPESRREMRALGQQLSDICAEIKLIVPDGKAHGWNIASALAEGMSWVQIAAWAKTSMMTFDPGEFPKLGIETTPGPDPVPASAEAAWDQIGVAKAMNGQPVLNVDNVVRVLVGWEAFKDIIWFDSFHQRYFTRWGKMKGTKPREWSDIDDINLTVLLQREFGLLRLSSDTVSAGIRCRAHQCVRNEPKEWMEAVRWDGRPRIDNFFRDYFGAKESGYVCAVSRNFWVGMVARIFRPGCQLDNMVILEGKQGIFKSRALEAIGGEWYMEAAEDISNKDFFVAMAGKLLVEIADLDSFSRADTNRIKKVITCRTDRYRMPYARATADFPRQSIFVGTTNEQHYLRDNTGGRRFWPITCGEVKIENIKKDRPLLFAEAVRRYLAGEDWYKVPQDETEAQQEGRRQFDEWENIIEPAIRAGCRTELFLYEVAAMVGIDQAKLDIQVQRRLGGILRRLGWTSKPARRGGSLQKVWVPNAASYPIAESDDPAIGQPLSAAQVPLKLGTD